MTRDEALKKIKKCLALAKSQNPNEAAVAMRQAQALMAAHALDDQDVSLSDVSESTAAAPNQANVRWVSILFSMVADAFGCDRYFDVGYRQLASGNWSRRRSAIFVGVGAAPKVASYAYEVLFRQCAKARQQHVQKQPGNCKPITKTARGDKFAFGWVCGVRDLLSKFANSDRSQLLLEAYMDAKHPNLQSIKPKDRAVGRNVRDDDFEKGIDSGRRAQLQHGVGGMVLQGLLS